MKSRTVTACLFACALWTIVPAARAQSTPDSPSIVGTWRLVTYEDRPDSGPSRFPFGAHPTGLLIYDATGHMSVQIMKVPHPKVASGDEEHATDAEKTALYDAYVAYFGTYRVDPDRGVVVHHAEGDLSDVYVGRDESRPYELSADRLVLKPRWTAEGRQWEGIRVFERIR
ncbi:MAG TPA: lipocalin-like domain-containing protein [Povalibacter sp.]|nr:lipocalin-like domain-containing protein [Povalibacter sp.]